METDQLMCRIVLFGISDCPDCSDQKEILEDVFGIDSYDFINLDSEEVDDLLLMAKYEVDDAPTTIVIKKDGDKARVFRHAGVISANKLQKFLDKIK